MITADLVRKSASEIFPALREIYRHLHAHPELSFEEYKTAEYIAGILKKEGITFKTGIAGTGILAEITGEGKGREVALRADMDALPIEEKNHIAWRSSNPGVMHACGHDVHSTCLLGALIILNRNRKKINGTVKAIFQPGEEKLPGGASLVLKEGVFNPAPDFIIGQHVFPELPAGKAGFRPGVYMASTDELHFTIRGKGGHAALPHRNIDPVQPAARLINELPRITELSPDDIPSILAIGKVIANGATNVIPDEVRIEGTFRTMDEDWRKEAHEHIRRIALEVMAGTGATCETDIRKGYPVLKNDPDITDYLRSGAEEFLGAENITTLDLRMTAEDFAWYTQLFPGCFYRLGTASPDGNNSKPVHSSEFRIDESALETGAGLMAWLALAALAK